MQTALTIGAVTAFASWALLFALLRSGIAGRIAIDTPNQRSLHTHDVPRVGGLVVIGVAAIALPFVASGVQVLSATVVALMLLFAVDDRRGLPVSARLIAQLMAAAVAAYTLLPATSWWIVLLGIVGVVWSMNLYNFMDGADGLAGGMTVLGFSALAIMAASVGALELGAACVCIAGAAAGFLLHNFPPAKVFLGDAGSVPLGFLAATLAVAGWQQQVWPIWFPLLVFSPFIVDATVTLLRRSVAGKRLWTAHREHMYQRMVREWGHSRTAVVWYGLMALAGGSAIAAVKWPNRWQIGLLIGWAALYAVLYAVVTRLTAPEKE